MQSWATLTYRWLIPCGAGQAPVGLAGGDGWPGTPQSYSTAQAVWQCPTLQAPVLTPAQEPETVTEDRWHQPWSETRVLTAKTMAVAAVVMMASGLFAPCLTTAQFPENPSEDRYHAPWSEPVRVKPGLTAQYQQYLAYSESARFPESVTEDRWHQPWSEPVRWRGLYPASQQYIAQSESARFPESVTVDRWLLGLSEPVRVKPALLTAANAAPSALTEAPPFLEAVSIDRWMLGLSEPVRLKPALSSAAQAANFFPVGISTAFYSISGVTRDSTLAPLGNCAVHLFNTANDVEVAVGTSDASGNYAFNFSANPGITCYIVAYKPGSPDRFGTTVNTLVPTLIPA